tara:strand:- start:12667 stop:13185 length:519 start_codon:yes stop_codon:yes gene_type:complete
MIVTEDSLASIIDGFPSIQINSSTNLKPQFGWGDDKELNRYIALRKSKSYPLIWLLPSEDLYEGSTGQSVVKECTFIIATRETRTMLLNEARYKASFAIVLNPLTDNLIKGLSSSNITSRSNSEYKIIKLPNYSDDEIKNGTIDLWDAISLKIDIRFTNNLKNLKPIIYENS